MKLGKGLLLFSVVLIVFLAGCAKSSETSTGAGVMITSFAPDIQQTDPGSSVTFTAVIKNIGSKSATNIKALLFGLSDEWENDELTKPVQSFTTLSAADPSAGLPGEETSFDWTATFDSTKGKNADVTYDASIRVFYEYTTDSDVLLRFVESSYLKTNPNVQKGIVSSQSSSGPLVITAMARTPSVGITATTGRVQFEIQNVGSGRVSRNVSVTGTTDVDPGGLDYIKEIKVTGAKSCAGESSVKGIVTLKDVRLAAGKSKVISCDVDVSNIANFKDIALKLTATYTYFIDSATQVTVLRILGEASTQPIKPAVLSTEPTSGAIGVSKTPTIIIKFNKAMNEDSVKTATEIRQGSTIFSSEAWTTEWKEGSTKFKITPPELAGNAETKVIVKSTAADKEGNTLASDFTLTFTTTA